MTSVEVNIDDSVVGSSAFIAFGVVWYLAMKVDTEFKSGTRISWHDLNNQNVTFPEDATAFGSGGEVNVGTFEKDFAQVYHLN
jgi:hypothetical protein